jgi:hypothetical protein
MQSYRAVTALTIQYWKEKLSSRHFADHSGLIGVNTYSYVNFLLPLKESPHMDPNHGVVAVVRFETSVFEEFLIYHFISGYCLFIG